MPTTIATRNIRDWAVTNAKQNFGTPSASTDVVIKSYLESYVANQLGAINLKDAVVVATTTNWTLATAFASGQVVDGYTLVTGDRILIKNQTTASENGIYTVNASGAPTRATDADTEGDILDAVVWVSKWTTNADTQWKMVTDWPITIDTTALVWTQPTSGMLTSGNFVFNETPSGTINGSNTFFTIANTPIAGKVAVYLNGMLMDESDDYTISGSTITFSVAPTAGDKVRVTYIK